MFRVQRVGNVGRGAAHGGTQLPVQEAVQEGQEEESQRFYEVTRFKSYNVFLLSSLRQYLAVRFVHQACCLNAAEWQTCLRDIWFT